MLVYIIAILALSIVNNTAFHIQSVSYESINYKNVIKATKYRYGI